MQVDLSSTESCAQSLWPQYDPPCFPLPPTAFSCFTQHLKGRIETTPTFAM